MSPLGSFTRKKFVLKAICLPTDPKFGLLGGEKSPPTVFAENKKEIVKFPSRLLAENKKEKPG